MSLGRSALRQIFQKFTRLQELIQPQAANVSIVNMPYPPLFESVPPIGFRYAIPLAISIGASVCVLIEFAPAVNDLISEHTESVVATSL